MRVRNVEDGRTGVVIETSKGKRVQLDSDLLGERTVSYLEQRWVPIVAARPLSPAHIAEICHAADQMLCRRTGLKKPTDWLQLNDDERRLWIEKGPQDVEIRSRLYEAMQGVLEELAQ